MGIFAELFTLPSELSSYTTKLTQIINTSILAEITYLSHLHIRQICFLVAMIQQDGFAPRTVNPMIGPPATTLVR